MKKIILIVALISLIISCTKEIKLKEEYIKPKLVGYSLFNEYQPWRFNLNTSASIFTKDSIKYIKDAHVSILDEEGNLIEVLQWYIHPDYPGYYNFYYGNTKPEKNKVYTITVEAEGYESIMASGRIPNDFNCQVDTNLYIEDFQYKMGFTLEISDNIDEHNYYIINVHQTTIAFDGNGNMGFDPFGKRYLTTKDPNVEQMGFELGIESEYGDENLLLRDDNFNGATYTLKFEAELEKFYNDQIQIRNGDTILPTQSKLSLNVYSVDKAYFLYILSKDKSYEAGDNPFSTPVKVYSNFENGLGVFAGVNFNTFEFDVTDLVIEE